MKIFHVITSLKIGGAESALLNFLRVDKNSEHVHYVAYFYPGPNLEKIQNLGIKTFHITGLLNKYDFLSYLKLRRIIKDIKPDVIHSSLWFANFFSKFVAKSLSIPVVCDLHSNFLHDGKIRKILERINLLDADIYVAVSNNTKNGFIKTFCSYKDALEKKTVVIPNAIDINYIKKNISKLNRVELGFLQRDFIIGAVGRLEKIKSYDLLIRAFYIFKNNLNQTNTNCNGSVAKNVKLCLVGGGRCYGELRKLTQDLGLVEDVVFAGAANNPYPYFNIFDCFAISSKSEGLSIALLEAMAFGLPVISTTYSPKHDVLVDGVNALLVCPGNPLALSRAMEKFYCDQDFSMQIGKENLNLIKQSFSISRVQDSYFEIFKKLSATVVRN